jgi:hypothetical protein
MFEMSVFIHPDYLLYMFIQEGAERDAGSLPDKPTNSLPAWKNR